MARGCQRAGPGTVYSLAGTCSGGDLAGVSLWPPRIGEGPGVQERPPTKVAFTEKTSFPLWRLLTLFPLVSGPSCPFLMRVAGVASGLKEQNSD